MGTASRSSRYAPGWCAAHGSLCLMAHARYTRVAARSFRQSSLPLASCSIATTLPTRFLMFEKARSIEKVIKLMWKYERKLLLRCFLQVVGIPNLQLDPKVLLGLRMFIYDTYCTYISSSNHARHFARAVLLELSCAAARYPQHPEL